MKRKILLLMILALLLLGSIKLFCTPYKKIDLNYIGSISGNCSFFMNENDETVSKEWEKRAYVYNGCQSYISFRGTEGFEAIAEACSFDSNDFTYDFKEECQYICAYEYPLASLEYSEKYITLNGRQYYNRARLDKKNYEKRMWFFYEIEDVNIGSMEAERELMGLRDLY